MCNVLTNLMDTHVHGDVPTQEHASARGTFIQCWLWFRTAAVLRMGWRVPVLAQTLNTHFLIIVEYYCLIVQGYERGGLWLIHFHVVLYTAGSCLIETCLIETLTFGVCNPWVDETIVDLTNVLKKVLPLLPVCLMACWHWNCADYPSVWALTGKQHMCECWHASAKATPSTTENTSLTSVCTGRLTS